MSRNSCNFSSYRIIAAQALNALGDYGAKIIASALVAALFPEHQASVLVGLISFLYIVPYLTLGAVTTRLAGRYSKLAIVKGALGAQVAALVVLSGCAALHFLPGVFVALAVVAAQSCVLGPARNALLREVAGTARVGRMIGLLELASVGSTLLGLALGGWSFDWVFVALGSPWTATAVVGGFSSVIALIAYLTARRIEAGDHGDREIGQAFGTVFRDLLRCPALRWTTLGLAWFYGAGTMMVMILMQDGRWDHGQSAGAASQSGLMAALLGLGVASGSGFAALLCRKRVEVGYAFVGAIGMSILAPIAAASWGSDLVSSIAIIGMGMFGGLFSAPLNANLLLVASDASRASVVAASNVVINGVTAVFIGLGSALAYLGWSPAAQLYIIGLSSLAVASGMMVVAPEPIVRLALRGVVAVLYPMRRRGVANVPERGGVLIVSNHVTFADAALIYAASPRPVRFIGTDEMLRFPWMRWVYRKFNVIPVAPHRAKDAIRKTVSALKAGEVVCVFPEGALTRTGTTMPFKDGATLIARLASAPVVPAYIDGMWGSFFSLAGKPFRFRRGMPMRRQVGVALGTAIEPESVSAERMRESVLQLGHELFASRPELSGSIGAAALRAMKRHPFETRLVDRSGPAKRYSNAALIALSLSLARVLKERVQTRRVAVLLPPGVGGLGINVAASLAGLSTVNLNPTVSADSFRSMLRNAGVDTIVTSRKLLERFAELSLDAAAPVFVEDVFAAMPRWRLAAAWLAAVACPYWLIRRIYGLSERRGHREATLLFSSGSSAEPKGIPLSHRNLLANVAQLSEVQLMASGDRILANLPLFHSFGLTGGLWLPLLKGMRLVTTPSPLQIAGNVEAIRSEGVTVLLGTPTFLRGYLRKASAEDFGSVRLVVAGAEKLPEPFAREWMERFGKPILEGYGLTECSPVLAANCLRSEALPGKGALEQSGYSEGTVGRVLPGTLLRIVSAENRGQSVAAGEAGLILVKAPNVFSGYLDAAQNAERFTEDGWFDTGDIGRVDSDGFLRIEGRLSRFSKIGGEMVSHQSVEQAIVAAYPEIRDAGEPQFAVTSRPSAAKGEELVLLSRIALEARELGQRLREKGIPNLWVPQAVKVVDAIPCLGTGKLDLKRCAELCLG